MSFESKTKKEQQVEWHQDPDNWKLGIFYFNKKDKRILPPKRNKLMGWTVNFANPVSVLVLIVLLVLIFLLPKFLR
ncbi:DUF5808 domain-containing protein [Algoriphagus sp.]|uniref:DUF5808 domain-containing protein n=1 Tax=Algoriphagus sp. TaxID=1872435 RepID=UPI00391C1C4D